MGVPAYVQREDLLEILQVQQDRIVSRVTAELQQQEDRIVSRVAAQSQQQSQQQFGLFWKSFRAAFTPELSGPLLAKFESAFKNAIHNGFVEVPWGSAGLSMLNPDTKIDSKLSGDAKATAKGGIVAKPLHIVEHYKVDSDDDGDRKLSDPDEGDGETSGIDEGSASTLPSSEFEALQMGIAAFTIGELESSASATSTHQDQKRFFDPTYRTVSITHNNRNKGIGRFKTGSPIVHHYPSHKMVSEPPSSSSSVPPVSSTAPTIPSSNASSATPTPAAISTPTTPSSTALSTPTASWTESSTSSSTPTPSPPFPPLPPFMPSSMSLPQVRTPSPQKTGLDSKIVATTLSFNQLQDIGNNTITTQNTSVPVKAQDDPMAVNPHKTAGAAGVTGDLPALSPQFHVPAASSAEYRFPNAAAASLSVSNHFAEVQPAADTKMADEKENDTKFPSDPSINKAFNQYSSTQSTDAADIDMGDGGGDEELSLPSSPMGETSHNTHPSTGAHDTDDTAMDTQEDMVDVPAITATSGITHPSHATEIAAQVESIWTCQPTAQSSQRNSALNKKRKRLEDGMSASSNDKDLSSTDVPYVFSLVGDAFKTELKRELLAFVRHADSLALLQPWFATLRLSSLPIPNWDVDLAEQICKSFFGSYQSGTDVNFQAKYRNQEKWVRQCKIVPIVHPYRYWLNDCALPVLIEHFSETLPQPTPFDSSKTAGPAMQERKEALSSILKAVAQAYLRMVLLKAQDSSTKSWLSSKSGKLELSDDAPLEWAMLQEVAVNIENNQVRQSATPEGSKQPPSYRELVRAAVCSFSEHYTSLSQEIAAIQQLPNKYYEEIKDSLHPRWLSIAAYLQDAEDQQKLILDDGVTQLLLELKKRTLRYTLKGLKLNLKPIRVHLDKDQRLIAVRKILVSLSLAYDGWTAAQVKKYSSENGTKQSIYKNSRSSLHTDLQTTAKRLERGIVSLVEKARSGQDISHVYLQHVKDICQKFVKDPIGKLKSAVISSHGRNHVNVVMGPREFTTNASLIQPEEIEVIYARTSRDTSDEPLSKRSCFRRVKDASPELARLPLWFGMVDGKLAPFTYGAPGST